MARHKYMRLRTKRITQKDLQRAEARIVAAAPAGCTLGRRRFSGEYFLQITDEIQCPVTGDERSIREACDQLNAAARMLEMTIFVGYLRDTESSSGGPPNPEAQR